PETWAMYGVDANGDGVKDPNNPEDAIFAAARYLSAAGMPGDVWGAIFAYNHADWYVEDVLANAGCYANEVGSNYATLSLAPQIQVYRCTPSEDWKKQIPEEYLAAFEAAAGRYELGKRGVWTLAAVARLESNFGRGMSKRQLRREGPLGLDKMEWNRYAVDGDKDGRLRHADADDAAATLARMMWSRGSIDAGVFTHNQASWYVDAVAHEANQLSGKCTTGTEDWAILVPGAVASQINWGNLTLSNDLELRDIQAGLLDQRITGLLALMTQEHQITITSLRSDHSQMTASGNVSNHYYGRAMDIAAVDGVSCTDTSTTAPCAELGYQLAQLADPLHPSELIYCFDLDGVGPAFALPDHCDHIHAGFYAY
ncbi:MAG TPA: lytic transglycosylase domain-containing protein, partial [Solirubrobacterales bacterium]|nr:lytic transglycosylase domain-containing protein [Solirubrobacterales bacterium]